MLNCAFLRGVNVNGRTLKMAEVCEMFRSIGMEQVSSVLATGNIIFQTKGDMPKLRETLETALSKNFQMESKLFVKNTNEIKSMLDAVPYASDPDWHIYIFICDAGFEQVLVEEFKTAASSGRSDESAAVKDGYFYWRVRKGSTLDTPFSKILSSRRLKEKFTSR
ncbi:MAG: DUF1697 domain-containing protein, partial [Methanomassiliicoccaceae archaeon]|nr:DUF1697 domain-containing protein [Methanomassiliicoccaceae archaeon]